MGADSDSELDFIGLCSDDAGCVAEPELEPRGQKRKLPESRVAVPAAARVPRYGDILAKPREWNAEQRKLFSDIGHRAKKLKKVSANEATAEHAIQDFNSGTRAGVDNRRQQSGLDLKRKKGLITVTLWANRP